MAKPVSIPNSFATSTAAIPLSYLDQDFNALANSTNDLATYSNYVADTGAANAYIANFPTNTNTSSLTAGLRVQFKAANANTGASTLNVQVNSVSIGSGSIVLTDGSALSANSIVANAVVDVIYDGSNFQLINDASGASETISNLTVTNDATIGGNLTFTSTGNRITGDFSNGTLANRVAFQTSTTNGATRITFLPNGTGTDTALNIYNTSDQTNNSFGQFTIDSTNVVAIKSNIQGTGSYFPMTFFTGGSERMRIDTSGNVGIGTSSPAAKLDVRTAAGTSAQMNLYSGNNTTVSKFNIGQIGAIDWDIGLTATNGHFLIGGLGGSTSEAYRINRSGTSIDYHAWSTGAGTERMRIDSSGNVGIGTTSPGTSTKLQVAGRAIFTDGASDPADGSPAGVVLGYNTGSSYGFIQAIHTGVATKDLYIQPTGTNNVIIAPNGGSVMVNKTAQVQNGKLTVGADLNVATGITVQNTNATPQNYFMIFANSASSIAGSISHSGSTTVAYNTSSDYRLKENVTPMTGALDTVAQLNPVTYTWKADGSDGQGFIAHELAEVVPDCVTGKKDAVDEEGNPIYQGIDTSFLVATLTKAIQEQQDIIKALETRIQALENQ